MKAVHLQLVGGRSRRRRSRSPRWEIVGSCMNFGIFQASEKGDSIVNQSIISWQRVLGQLGFPLADAASTQEEGARKVGS